MNRRWHSKTWKKTQRPYRTEKSPVTFSSLILSLYWKPSHWNSVCVRSLPIAETFSETPKSSHQLTGSQHSLSEMPHKQALCVGKDVQSRKPGKKKLISRRALIRSTPVCCSLARARARARGVVCVCVCVHNPSHELNGVWVIELPQFW